MSGFLRSIRQRRIRHGMRRSDETYAAVGAPDEIRDWQLRRFNTLWARISESSPYYARLKRARRLPERFAHLTEFKERMPITSRGDLRSSAQDMRAGLRPADYRRVTGGSTSEPVQIPAWRSEDRITELDCWRARSWFDIAPADRLFLVWGHGHLLSRGYGRWAGGIWRSLKDICLGYRRFSAYDLGDAALGAAGDALLEFRPRYMLGYSVALHRLAHANRYRTDALRRLNLKAVIATGESFPSPQSASLISQVFGCPVAMEYGAMETGTMAHQRPDARFQIFWANYMLEGIESGEWPGCYELLVTTLYPRLIPLIRYRIGDLISGNPDAEDFDQCFERVIGRCNDGLSIGGGTFVHSEAFSHVLRDVEEIQAFQVVQTAAEEIVINYVAEHMLSEEMEHRLHDRLARVHEGLKVDRFEKVGQLRESVSGKTKRIVNESGSRLF